MIVDYIKLAIVTVFTWVGTQAVWLVPVMATGSQAANTAFLYFKKNQLRDVAVAIKLLNMAAFRPTDPNEKPSDMSLFLDDAAEFFRAKEWPAFDELGELFDLGGGEDLQQS